jgi:hypothetical protein
MSTYLELLSLHLALSACTYSHLRARTHSTCPAYSVSFAQTEAAGGLVQLQVDAMTTTLMIKVYASHTCVCLYLPLLRLVAAGAVPQDCSRTTRHGECSCQQAGGAGECAAHTSHSQLECTHPRRVCVHMQLLAVAVCSSDVLWLGFLAALCVASSRCCLLVVKARLGGLLACTLGCLLCSLATLCQLDACISECESINGAGQVHESPSSCWTSGL